MTAIASADIFLFENFRFDRRAGVLFERDREGVFVPLVVGSRAAEVLGVLVEHPGDLVTRDEMMDAVWPGTVVEDGNLSVQISALRRVLDNGRSEGGLIQTVPGRGYRFLGQVTSDRPDPPPSAAPSRNGHGDADPDLPDGSLPTLPAPTAIKTAPKAGALTGSHLRLGLVVLVIAACLTGITAPLFWQSGIPWFERAVPAIPRLSIVVLPFNNLSSDPEQQYFADGITEEVTTDLSRIADTFVISRNTAFTYKNKPIDAKQVGRELGVRYVLEGSVHRLGRHIRVIVQLIDAASNAHLWADRFDGDTGDLFALQNEITSRIAIELSAALVRAEAARPTANPDALDYIFRARAMASNPPTRERAAEVIGLYERALEVDPASSEAKTRLAFALAGRVLLGMSANRDADLARAEGLLGQISRDTPRAHWAKGQLLRAQGRYTEAIAHYEEAIALDRNLPGAYANLGQSKLLSGSLGEVIPLMEQAIRLSPRDPDRGYWYDMIGLTHLLQSRINEAIAWFEKARSASPARPIPRVSLAAAYGLKGESERAAAELAEARKLSGDPAIFSTIAARRKATSREFFAPKVRALFEETFDLGLRKAGMPDE